MGDIPDEPFGSYTGTVLPQEEQADEDQLPVILPPGVAPVTYPLPELQNMDGIYSDSFNHAWGQNIVGGLNINGDNSDMAYNSANKVLTDYSDCEKKV